MTEQKPAPTGVASSTELGFLPPYKYGEECGKLERVWTERDMHAFAAQKVAAERERICVAIKAADDKSVDEAGYMLDSTDCISIVRGTWSNTEVDRASGSGRTQS